MIKIIKNLLHECVQLKAIVIKFPQCSQNSIAQKGFLFDCYALRRQNVNNERYLLRRGKGEQRDQDMMQSRLHTCIHGILKEESKIKTSQVPNACKNWL